MDQYMQRKAYGSDIYGLDDTMTDRITGLPSITAFQEQFDPLKMQLLESGREPVLIYFNVTNLKSINNRHGFTEGNNVLRNVAMVLQNTFTESLISRLAEDHFTLLTSSKDPEGLGIRDRVVKVQDSLRDLIPNFSGIKAGVYRLPLQISEIPSVSECCDCAKLACESIRKNYAVNYCEYDSKLKAQQEIETFILEHFNKAIEQNEIDVWYQPIIRTTSRQITELEGLCRWIDPQKGFISPSDFIPVLEDYHLIEFLDRHILRRICEGISRRRDNGEPVVPISVNISRLDFELAEDFCTSVCQILEEYHIPRNLIHIEITESALSKNPQFMKQQISGLRNAGFALWMDDFGSGYSSFNTLEEFRFDTIKLDMMFMRNLKSGPQAHIILKNLISMLKDLKLQIVVEGVETKEQYKLLHQMGCDFVQGWLFSPAVPESQILSLVHSGPKDLSVYSFETESDDRSYYDQVGLVNTLHPDLEGIGENILDLVTEVPAAVIEYRNNRIRYIRTSPSYRKFLNSIHIRDEAQSELLMNDMSRKLAQGFHEGFRQTVQSEKWASMDFLEQDMFCTGHARVIAKNPRTGAASILFLCLNLTNFGFIDRADLATKVLHPVLSLYSRIDLLQPGSNIIRNLYCDSQRYTGQIDLLQEINMPIERFAQMNVREDQREDFLAYYDMSTMRKRLAQNGGNHLAAVFDTRTMAGDYEPQLYVMINTREGEEEKILSCVRDVTSQDLIAFGGILEREYTDRF